MTEFPVEDAREQDVEPLSGGASASRLRDTAVEADEADAVEQATDVPMDEDEYR